MVDFDIGHFQLDLFQNFIKLKNNMDQLILPITQKYQLTPFGVVILYLINKNKDITIGNIQKRLHVNQGNLSSICKKLEMQGYLLRNRSKKDERVVTLSLTQNGQEILDSICKEICNLKFLLEEIPKERLHSAQQGLRDLVDLFLTLNEAARKQEEI